MMGIFLTALISLFFGYCSNVILTKISFKQRTIDNKIKIYDALITNWVQMRNHILHGELLPNFPMHKWNEGDKIYGQSQTYVGEAFLVCDNQVLVEDINAFNEDFYRQGWHELSRDQMNDRLNRLKTKALLLISRMRSDIHDSTRLTWSDLTHIFRRDAESPKRK